MEIRKMNDGSVACGESNFLDMFNQLIKTQQNFESTVKFRPNTKVEVVASIEDLISYFEETETPMSAKNHAFVVLGNKVGTVLSANNFSEGLFYTVEFETEPMCLLPERFLNYYLPGGKNYV